MFCTWHSSYHDGRAYISQEVQDGTPALYVLALDADEQRLVTGRGVAAAVGGGGGGGVAASATQWLLVAWIPDDSKVSC